MEVRTILYGYSKNGCSFVIVDKEAEIVRKIFNDYISGSALKAIAEDLTSNNIVYYKDKTSWSKAGIRRILENIHYIGDEYYQQIISKDIFDKASSLRLGKGGGTREKDEEIVKLFKNCTICAQCGSRFTRRSKYKTREKWMCSNGCNTGKYLDDGLFYSKVLEQLNHLISNPALARVQRIEGELFTPNLNVYKQEKEIRRMISLPDLQFKAVKKVVFECVEEKFNCCKLDKSFEVSELLVEYIGNQKQLDELDLDFIKRIIETISVLSNGKMILTLINGAKISPEMEGNNNDSSNITY